MKENKKTKLKKCALKFHLFVCKKNLKKIPLKIMIFS